VLAVARRSYGQPREALAGLEPVLAQFPNDVEIVLLLAELSAQNNDHPRALKYARRLVELVPNDPNARRFLQQLQKSAG